MGLPVFIGNAGFRLIENDAVTLKRGGRSWGIHFNSMSGDILELLLL